MPKITSIEPQKKTLRPHSGPKRFNIYLDGQFAFGVDEDLVVNYRLIPGKSLDTSDVERLLFEAEVGKLMEKMYRWFSLRQHSEKEVREYFKIKNQKSKIKNGEPANDLVIDALVETLKKKGLVNDLEFTKAWIEARRRSKQKGIRAIKAELFQKGIDKEIIESMDNGQWTIENEEQLARQALEKKMKVWRNLPTAKLYQKATQFLMRKGFDYETVKKVVKEKFAI